MTVQRQHPPPTTITPHRKVNMEKIAIEENHRPSFGFSLNNEETTPSVTLSLSKPNLPFFPFSLALMAFHRRKLLDPATYCKPFCDNGFCPSTCFDFCPPDTCTEQTDPIIPPPPPPLPPPASSTTIIAKSPPLSVLLIASLAVLAAAFFIFTCYTIYKFYGVWRKSRRRGAPQLGEEGGPDDNGDDSFDYGPVVDHPIWFIRTVGLQPSEINAITIVKYRKSDGLVDGADCAVCLSEFQEDETVRLLPKCSHAFHIPCIDTWLASHTNCPMCRAGIVSVSNATGPSPAPVHDSSRSEAGSAIEAETRIEIEDDGPAVEPDGDPDCKTDVVQPVRRSVSMDSVAASVISAAVANAVSENSNSEKQAAKAEVGRRSVGVNRASIGSSSIKRSASCSAKVFLSRQNSSRSGR